MTPANVSRGWVQWQAAVAGFYALFAAVVIFWRYQDWAYDDPFITYRYAHNLAYGFGYVFNPGERVQSTTTPLFTLLLAGLQWLGGDIPRLANLMGALSIGAGAWLLWDLAHTWRAPRAGWVALLLYPTFFILLITLGSETPLYLALGLGAFASYARKRHEWAAVSAALALLTRGDGALVAALLVVDYGLRARGQWQSIPWRAVLIYGALTVPWFLFAWGYFGWPLPATLAVKQQQGLMAISRKFAPGFARILGWHTTWTYSVLAGLAVLGATASTVRGSRWLAFVLWPILYFVAYTALQVSSYPWYYTPLVPGFVMAAGLGVEWLWQSRWGHAVWTRASLLALVGAIWVVQSRTVWQTADMPDVRREIYRVAGEWLHTNTQPTASVGTLEVGIIGYYARRPIVDFAGLIQPVVAQQFALGATYQDSARWAIEHYQPEYLVLNPGWFPELLHSQVEPKCAPVQQFPGEAYDYAGELVIYRCSW